MFGGWTYLVLLFAWALPVLALQWALGWRDLWRARRAWLLATLLPTLYLCLADRFALGSGIWHIHESRRTGAEIGGLPLEEALFFLLTNLMVAQTLIFFHSETTRRRVSRLRSAWHGLAPAAGPALAAGHRRGTLGAVLGVLLSTVSAAALTAPSVLEPVAQAVMQLTPVAVANVLLQRLDPVLARSLALFGALALLLVGGGLLGAVAAAGRAGGAVAWIGLAGATALLAREAAPLPALAYGAGQALLLLPRLPYLPHWPGSADRKQGEGHPAPESRRAYLRHNLWVAGGAAGTLGVAALDAARRDRLPGLAGKPLFPYQEPPARVAGFPVPGQAPEVTPVARFYVVSKNAQDPALDSRFWRLSVDGMVARPASLTFDDLLGASRRDEYVTFQCVSNPVGGSLMSNALWSGAGLRDLLERAGPLPGAGRVVFRAPDGHEESVPLELALRPDTMIAYAMNGELLTRLHGHPARALLPGLYGFKQVKWLTEVRVAPDSHRGYWPRRGWTDEATIRTTARIDLARREPAGVRVAGMALAGRRGISAVEVRVGAGDGAGAPWTPWTPAEAHLPTLSGMTWAQWRALLTPPPGATGDLLAEARAVDGEGRPQEVDPSGPFPNGASGYHRVPVR